MRMLVNSQLLFLLPVGIFRHVTPHGYVRFRSPELIYKIFSVKQVSDTV